MPQFSAAPPTVKDLAASAEAFEFTTTTPFQSWLRTADAINKQAHSYLLDGDDQNAYIFLLRHAILVFERLNQYPDSRSSSALAATRKIAQANVRLLEDIKPRINARNKRFNDILLQHNTLLKQRKSSPLNEAKHIDPAGYQTRHEVDPNSNLDLARELANRTVSAKKVLDSDWDVAGDIRKITSALESSSRSAATPSPSSNYRPAARSALSSKESNFIYPSVPSTSKSAPHAKQVDAGIPPHQQPTSSWPTRSSSSNPPPLPSKDTPAQPPQQKPNKPEQSYFFKPVGFTENGTPLRTIFMSPVIQSEFVNIARPNTQRNLETCGILCGFLKSNALFITHLVIPDQVSTSDTCDTVNEEALFEYCDSNNLLTIGWIHTHPTQDCFMSSRDLHTHSGYQVQIPESIAIVCAPSKTPSWGIFRLTEPPGLQAILSCTQTATFHPHSTGNLYTDSTDAGHVRFVKDMGVKIKDLRT